MNRVCIHVHRYRQGAAGAPRRIGGCYWIGGDRKKPRLVTDVELALEFDESKAVSVAFAFVTTYDAGVPEMLEASMYEVDYKSAELPKSVSKLIQLTN